ncbi:hypothetical protein EVAR_38126_1 [Eumeta japonica]|uniref:Uncharacterized protein n=1 Tax=Eumeta variegata TaxID=151549 RepID=A0A4C1X8T4_EUMVA|nr:hypothetical protein EVAR_38126_1 [Eumeta japonica]
MHTHARKHTKQSNTKDKLHPYQRPCTWERQGDVSFELTSEPGKLIFPTRTHGYIKTWMNSAAVPAIILLSRSSPDKRNGWRHKARIPRREITLPPRDKLSLVSRQLKRKIGSCIFPYKNNRRDTEPDAGRKGSRFLNTRKGSRFLNLERRSRILGTLVDSSFTLEAVTDSDLGANAEN